MFYMTDEQKLAAVIHAYTEHGCHTWNVPGIALDANEVAIRANRLFEDRDEGVHILAILFDPEGLRALHGSEFQQKARAILDAWLILGGDDDYNLTVGGKAAIDRAYSQLPARSD